MDGADVRSWWDQYLDVFAACGRGDREATDLAAFCAVPLLLSADAGVLTLDSEDAIIAWLQRAHVEPMRAAGYHHSDVVDCDVTVLNATSALVRAAMSRRHADGSEIARVTATYLVVDAQTGRRIAAMAVHSP